MGALRGHGWVITSEEQDTHELFHVLTSTIEDEILSGAPVPSLLDVTWLDGRGEEPPEEGVALRAAVWRLNNTTLGVKSCVALKEELNGFLCGQVQNLAHFGLLEQRGGEGGGRCGNGEVSNRCVSGEASETHNGGEKNEGCDTCEGSEEMPRCDTKSCEHSAMISGQCGDSSQDTHERESKSSCIEKTVDFEETSEGTGDLSKVRPHPIPTRCDSNKNMKLNMTPKTPKKHKATVDRTRDSDIARRKSRSEHQDIPFRGYLASQLQCTVCGHKVKEGHSEY